MLSLSMIVRDEEARLGTCLKSVEGFCDELVVLDTGSSDNTVAIAEAAGARVETMEWPGDFTPARNRALELVNGDWVLVLDADEILLADVQPALKALMAQPDVLVINLLRFEEGAAQSPYSSVSRLFRRHPAIRWSRAYHTMIDDSVEALLQSEGHWRVVDCAEPALVHSGYRPDVLASGNKAERLREAMEAELQRQPGDPYACAKLGGLEIESGNQARGLELLQLGLENCRSDQHNERYELLLHLGIAQSNADPEVAERCYRQALDEPLAPRVSAGARLNLGALLLRQNRLDEAASLSEAVTRQAPELVLGWYNLGLIQRKAGRIAEALQAYDTALELAPDNAELHQNRGAAQLIGGNFDAARDSFLTAIGLLLQQDRQEEAEELARRASELVKLDAA
ncbi:MAG: glycosyltransferase [Synechococcus sp.]|nr:glycosyltransferase [Synechococcus sp.]